MPLLEPYMPRTQVYMKIHAAQARRNLRIRGLLKGRRDTTIEAAFPISVLRFRELGN